MSSIRKNVKITRELLLELKTLTAIDKKDFEPDAQGIAPIDRSWDMSAEFPEENTQVIELWDKLQASFPPGYSITSNLLRHLHFNQAQDWHDISNYDIPLELNNLAKYEKSLVHIEYLATLHPEVRRIIPILLNGDIDASLKTLYSSFEARIRSYLSIPAKVSTLSELNKAFSDGRLSFHDKDYSDRVRDFLSGVLGYHRNTIVHSAPNTFSDGLLSNLSLFIIAHEAFSLFELCTKR